MKTSLFPVLSLLIMGCGVYDHGPLSRTPPDTGTLSGSLSCVDQNWRPSQNCQPTLDSGAVDGNDANELALDQTPADRNETAVRDDSADVPVPETAADSGPDSADSQDTLEITDAPVLVDVNGHTLVIQLDRNLDIGEIQRVMFRMPVSDSGMGPWVSNRCTLTPPASYPMLGGRTNVLECIFDPTGLPDWTGSGLPSGRQLQFFFALRWTSDTSYLPLCPADHSTTCPLTGTDMRVWVIQNGVPFRGPPRVTQGQDMLYNADYWIFTF